MLNADEVDHHGTRPVVGVSVEQRLDGMNVAGVVNETVKFTGLGENGRTAASIKDAGSPRSQGTAKDDGREGLYIQCRLVELLAGP